MPRPPPKSKLAPASPASPRHCPLFALLVHCRLPVPQHLDPASSTAPEDEEGKRPSKCRLASKTRLQSSNAVLLYPHLLIMVISTPPPLYVYTILSCLIIFFLPFPPLIPAIVPSRVSHCSAAHDPSPAPLEVLPTHHCHQRLRCRLIDIEPNFRFPWPSVCPLCRPSNPALLGPLAAPPHLTLPHHLTLPPPLSQHRESA